MWILKQRFVECVKTILNVFMGIVLFVPMLFTLYLTMSRKKLKPIQVD